MLSKVHRQLTFMIHWPFIFVSEFGETLLCEKFHYDRLRNDRALGNRKSVNNPSNKQKNNVRDHRGSASLSKKLRFNLCCRVVAYKNPHSILIAIADCRGSVTIGYAVPQRMATVERECVACRQLHAYSAKCSFYARSDFISDITIGNASFPPWQRTVIARL